MNILLVDDSRMMRNMLKKGLEGLGQVQFTEACDGIEALAAISSAAAVFNLIMVDWNMPNMDGITLVGRIRQNDKKTPLIMVTTEGEKGRIIEAIKAGVNNYVLKPFAPEALLEKAKLTLAKAA